MIKIACFFSLLFLLSCKTTTYYIVRHAEKQANGVSADPPLTIEGEKQALDLKNFLQNKKIKTIYSTNYTRTLATAEPTRQVLGGEIKLYKPTALIELTADLKKINDGNVLVVGHSNTVDDLVNGLTGENKMNDLADTEYGNVFIVKKKGTGYSFKRMKVLQTARR